MAASPDFALVVGGSGAGEPNDFGLFDIASESWISVPDPPFDDPLNAAAVTWTGTQFVVVGTRCSEVEFDDAVLCSPGGAAAASFDPVKGEWQSIAAPDGTPNEEGWHFPTSNAAQSVLQSSGGVSLLDHSTLAWEPVDPPFDEHHSLCLVDDDLIAISGQFDAPAGRTMTLPSGDWSATTTASVELPLQLWAFACGADAAWALSIDQRQASPGALLLQEATFAEGPHPGNELADVGFSANSSEGMIVANRGGQFAFLDTARMEWGPVSQISGRVVALEMVRPDRFLVATYEDGEGQPGRVAVMSTTELKR